MNMKKLLTIAVISAAALLATCTMAFASNAVVDSEHYTHPGQFSDTLVIDGVDVSYWQKDIDWNKVKRQGIDYAYIRIGVSYLDSPFSMGKDSYFEQNYREAREAGVMVGVYYYSTAINMKEARQEAKFVLDTLGGRDLDLPVVYDFELDAQGRQHAAYYKWNASERKSKATSNCLAFLNYIRENSDYEPMFYSYRSITSPYLNPGGAKLNMNLIDSKYRVWLAQYSTDNSYERPYDTWQYTSGGSVTGISGRTDCNFWYYDNSAEQTEPGTKSIKDASVSLGKTSFTYTKFKKYPTPTVTFNGTRLQKDVDYKVRYIKNVLAGTAYAWIQGIGDYSNVKLVPFTIKTADIADGGKIADIADQTYSGSAKKPAVKVSFTGTTLKKDLDYTVSYSNHTDAGTATVKITGKRNFHGTMTKTFKILKATPKFTGYTTYFRTPDREDFRINTKSSNKDARLTYASSDTSIAKVNGNGTISLQGGIGTAVITVTSPETKNYKKAIRKVSIKVTKKEEPVEPSEPVEPETPDQPDYDGIISGVENTTIDTSAVSDGSGIRVSWKKSKGYKMDRYEIYRSTENGVFGTKPYFTTKSSEASSYKNTGGLKSGTHYYYKVRGVREIDGKTYYSRWSNQVSCLYQSSASLKLIQGVTGTSLKASSAAGNNYIKISWSKSPGYKIDFYEVYRSTKKGEYDEEKPYFITKDGTKMSYKNTKGLKKGTRYYYKVRGVREIDGTDYYTKWSSQAYRTFK